MWAACWVLVSCVLCVAVATHVLWRRLAVAAGRRRLRGQHVLVTGGSSGIGLSVAVLAAKYGARVTIVARDEQRLAAAKRQVAAAGGALHEDETTVQQRVATISCDVAADPSIVAAAVQRAQQHLGQPVDTLICCAGYAVARRFDQLSVSEHRRLMDVNYFGAMHVLHALVPAMCERRGGRVCVVSSLGGLVGLWGFSGYCASKFALVGLAEVLQQEVRAYGVSVTVCCPPDTDTPGFATENRDKPDETRLVCESAGLATADRMAQQLLDDTMCGRFSCTLGLEGFISSTLALAAAPANSFVQVLAQLFCWPLLRLAILWQHRSWNQAIMRLLQHREMQKKDN